MKSEDVARNAALAFVGRFAGENCRCPARTANQLCFWCGDASNTLAAMLQAERQAGREEGSIYNGHTAREWSLALQGLTPGGSEYATDPQACADYVRRGRDDVMEIRKQHAKALTSLRAERDDARATIVSMLEHDSLYPPLFRAAKAEQEAEALRAENAALHASKEKYEIALRHAITRNHGHSDGCAGCKLATDLIWAVKAQRTGDEEGR